MQSNIKKNATFIRSEAIDITSVGDMGLSTNANFNHTVSSNSIHKISGDSSINVLGSFKNKIGGTTHKEHAGAFYERWDGDKHTYTGADTFSRHESGTDHSCPTDITKNGESFCVDIQTTGV